MRDDDAPRSKGVQSIETGMRILFAFGETRGPMALSEISQRVGIAPAKVHRYLASFVECGMVEHRASGAYDLGRAAAEIGVAAIARIDVVNRASDALPALVDATRCTAMLSVWGTEGPTVIRWERSSPPLVAALGVGSVLPLTTSATGLAFLCWSPDRLVRDRLPDEGAAIDETVKQEIRASGVAVARETLLPGLSALAAPVLDLQGQAAAVVTLVSTDGSITNPAAPARAALSAAFPVDPSAATERTHGSAQE